MLKQYEIIIDNNERKLFPITEYETEDIYLNIDNMFETMIFLNSVLKFGYMESEHLYILAYDYNGNNLGIYLAGIGENNNITIDKRKICMFLLLSGATQFIMIHNHPGDVLMASKEDMECFFDAKNMGNIIGLNLIGSYIITKSGYYNIQTQDKIMFNFDDIEGM